MNQGDKSYFALAEVRISRGQRLDEVLIGLFEGSRELIPIAVDAFFKLQLAVERFYFQHIAA